MLTKFVETDHRKVSRFRLIMSVLGVVIIIAAILVSVQFYQTMHNKKQFSAFVVKSVAGIEKKKLEGLIDEIEGTLKVFRDWGESGLIDISDPNNLNAKLFPIFKQHPLIQALVIADSRGTEYMIFRADRGFRTFFVKASGPKGRVAYVQECTAPDRCQKTDEATAAAAAIIREKIITEGYDASDMNEIQWSTPVITGVEQGPAVGATLHYQDKKDPKEHGVVSIIVNLDDIFGAVQAGRTTPVGIPFLLETEDWHVLVKHQEFSGCHTIEGQEQKVDSSDVLKHVVAEWKQKGNIPHGPFSFSWMGRKWWIAISPLGKETEGSDHRMWVGTLIPESDMREMVSASSSTPVVFYLVVLLAGAGLIAWLMWKHGSVLSGTGHGQDTGSITPDDIIRVIEQGEGDQVEFKSTMRKNLHTGKFGKEIELAWLKAVVSFMNSKGGILLIGVDDKGNVVGIEEDEFENDDRCGLHFKNLINQHVGAEFFPFIDFAICEIGGKKVVAVRVRSSDRPVFLTVGKDEAFWVRSGPSNMKLSVSKALHYIETRKKQGKK